jgi:hypothetical protein
MQTSSTAYDSYTFLKCPTLLSSRNTKGEYMGILSKHTCQGKKDGIGKNKVELNISGITHDIKLLNTGVTWVKFYTFMLYGTATSTVLTSST